MAKNNYNIGRPTGLKAKSSFRNDNKLYLQRAKIALPILVRQAKAGEPIYYSDLSEEMGMPNPRNLNYVLGAIGNILKDLERRHQIVLK